MDLIHESARTADHMASSPAGLCFTIQDVYGDLSH
jgi:hypothetical protein